MTLSGAKEEELALGYRLPFTLGDHHHGRLAQLRAGLGKKRLRQIATVA